MKVRILEYKCYAKHAQVLFEDPRDGHLSYNVAVLFPVQWQDGKRVDLSMDQVQESLSSAFECDVVWSKKLGSYVVRL